MAAAFGGHCFTGATSSHVSLSHLPAWHLYPEEAKMDQNAGQLDNSG
jgi:hypothetical protein